MSTPIRTHALGKRFRRVVALDRVDLAVEEGSVYALIGANGAGKTTLIKMLMNIMAPTSGSAELWGVDSRKLGVEQMAQIGYVSENQEMPGWMTVARLLAFCKPFYPTWDDNVAQELVKQFALPLDRPLKHLSRGMRMKAALVSSLACRPKLIMLDEPFSGLDPLVRDEFSQGLLERAANATVFISSHDLTEIETFASHIGYLDNGRLQFSEELRTLYERCREVELTLESPVSLPQPWPAEWLHPESSPALVRFLDTRFDDRNTPARLRALFPNAKDIAVRALSLRDIFVALAKSSRKVAA
ncbi:MAG: ABC transporter ATP-binding protein [Acidobacteriaceae bacterium]|nr:ABC transporter ATP-binding protein [Acidobacteriaceae bacterium]